MGQASFCLPDFKVIKQNTHTHTHTHPSLTQTLLSPLLDWSVLEHTRDSSFPLPLLFPWRQQVTESRNRICSKEGTPWPSSGWDRALSLQGPPVPTSRGCCILCIQFHSIDGKTTLPKSACGLLCPALCGSTDCSPPGSSVHGIFQARVLGWVAISSSRR